MEINKSKSHSDKTGSLTPLVVTLSIGDKVPKVTGVNLICIVDISGSMGSDNRMNLVKESLRYLVNLINSQDRLAIVTFNSNSYTLIGLTQMTSANKNSIITKINNLNANGGTNIYQGLSRSLGLITTSYSSGNLIASMILLSDEIDGESNCYSKFVNLISSQKKTNYVFTLHKCSSNN